MLKTNAPLERYLQPTPLVDYDRPELAAWIAAYGPKGREETQIVHDAFEFVRDQVRHSCDIQSRRVTAKASDVLMYREGICYAKSHLLAALLRGMDIPAGLCYQKLTLGDMPEAGYCIHALNTVYLSSRDSWIGLDARGNKFGINSQFLLDREQLAFAVHPEYGEVNYGTNYPEPPPIIAETLIRHNDCLEMCPRYLPTDLVEDC